MNVKIAKENGFAHVGYTYNVVKIYAKDVDSHSPDIAGVNWFNNILLEIATWLDINLQLNDGFYMDVTEIK